jgi:hypothetical protein
MSLAMFGGQSRLMTQLRLNLVATYIQYTSNITTTFFSANMLLIILVRSLDSYALLSSTFHHLI